MRSTSQSSSASKQADTDSGGISAHTRALAERLSSHMGLETAIQVSTENQWHGVVAALMEMRRGRNVRR